MGDDVDMKFVLFFDCSEEVMLKRIMSRAKAAGDNKWKDDNEESAKKRFITYHESTMPIIDLYEKQGRVRKINAERLISAMKARE